MPSYNEGFKARMVQRMAGPERISAMALSREVNVSQSTLSRWLREGRTVVSMSKPNDKKSAGRGSRSAEEKLRLVIEASQLSDEDLGGFLRREGLHEAELREWRSAATTALSTPSRRARKASPEARELKELKIELRRKEKALAETAALLALKKKIAEIWGDEDDDTSTRNGT